MEISNPTLSELSDGHPRQVVAPSTVEWGLAGAPHSPNPPLP